MSGFKSPITYDLCVQVSHFHFFKKMKQLGELFKIIQMLT